MIVQDVKHTETLEIPIQENLTRSMELSIEFDTPANRIISQLEPKDKFGINTSLPDMALLRQLSVQGRLRYNFANDSTLTIIPTLGSTQFFYKIYLTATSLASTFVINNSGQERGAVRLGSLSAIQLDFFDSLVGNSIDALTITSSGGASRIIMFSWIENTSRIRDVTT